MPYTTLSFFVLVGVAAASSSLRPLQPRLFIPSLLASRDRIHLPPPGSSSNLFAQYLLLWTLSLDRASGLFALAVASTLAFLLSTFQPARFPKIPTSRPSSSLRSPASSILPLSPLPSASIHFDCALFDLLGWVFSLLA
ncbi:hypothetical protein BJY01DRAFT_175933 [Aspergillus pseudoustus]|uniref:Uncharacterized protein n=1 Tax=Aspergillus pseudoustus TaxID=1810923 RepID=A0ABR4K1J5_9EURO